MQPVLLRPDERHGELADPRHPLPEANGRPSVGIGVAGAEAEPREPVEVGGQRKPDADARQVGDRTVHRDRFADPCRPVDELDPLPMLDREAGTGLVADDSRRDSPAAFDLGPRVDEAIEAVRPPTGGRRRCPPVPRRVIVVRRRSPDRQRRPTDHDTGGDDAVVADLDRGRTARPDGLRRVGQFDRRLCGDPSARRPAGTAPGPEPHDEGRPPAFGCSGERGHCHDLRRTRADRPYIKVAA